MYKLEGGVSYDYTPTYDELYDDYKRGAIDKNALIDLAQKRKELDYKQANMQQLKDTTLDGVRAVIGGGLEGASFHPILNIPYIGTGLGGALFEWGDSINNKRSAIDTLKNMGKGFVVGETVGAIPYAGKAIGKTKVGSKFGDVANKAYQRIADTSIGAKMGQGLNKVGDLLMTDVKAFNPNKQVAWHGSPVDFDKFDNAYIGTGEGAQAHGLGHYTAKSKNIADKRYRQALTGDDFDNQQFFYGNKLIDDRNKKGILSTIYENGKDKVLQVREKTIDRYKYDNNEYLKKLEELNWIKSLNENLIKKDTNKGQLYELRIPPNDVMLREEASFAEQPQAVQNALKDIQNEILQSKGYNSLDEINTKLNVLNSEYEKLVNKQTLPWESSPTTQIQAQISDLERIRNMYDLGGSSRNIYDQLKKTYGNKTSELLNNKGIKGISYNGGIDGEANVIFNPDDIDIVRKYYNQPQAMEYFQSINPNLGAETEAISNGLVDKKYWKKYAKDNMIGKNVDVPDYTTVNFTNKNLGKDYIHNLPEYPTLFDQLAGSKYAFSTNYKDEPDRLYDHLVNTNNNRLFDYLIEVIQGTDGKIHHNYKMMKNLKKGDEI